uniref:Uncharacterized protein n=1 Tax=Cyclophora tenuis TaxID=216820 RepID=A0A7S1GMH3_CYCTE|mmetsp:Transcript_23159/g.39352  ORF Transcript_23159/g.39352 Transcript_23159/m.39352 type:complete len:159 (+) Transcript_23159:450-926(+)
MLQYKPFPAFPPIPSKQSKGSAWMTPEQSFTVIFGWASIGLLGFIVMLVVRLVWTKTGKFFFRPQHFAKVRNVDSYGFSDIKDINGYIPEHYIPGALFPTLLADVSNIEESLLAWQDVDSPNLDRYNAIYDIPGLHKESPEESVFSLVRHWPPEGKTE